jgi:curli biogenesis system outer membrane secretion channel CsgG
VLALSAGLFSAPPVSAQDADLRYTVMVSEFENRSGWQGNYQLGQSWGTILSDQLNQSGHFMVVAQAGMRKAAMDEQALAASGATAQGRHTPTRGQMAPAQLLVKGVITHFQHQTSGKKRGFNIAGIGLKKKHETAEINVTIQLIDSTTGMVIASKSVVGTSTQKKKSFSFDGGDLGLSNEVTSNENVVTAVTNAVSDAIGWMISQLDRIPWRGTVVMVKGGRVYIDRGSREGVTEGRSFAVGESEVIRSPDTGEVLDEIITERARIKAVQVRDKISICTVTDGDASTIYKGMGITPASL